MYDVPCLCRASSHRPSSQPRASWTVTCAPACNLTLPACMLCSTCAAGCTSCQASSRSFCMQQVSWSESHLHAVCQQADVPSSDNGMHSCCMCHAHCLALLLIWPALQWTGASCAEPSVESTSCSCISLEACMIHQVEPDALCAAQDPQRAHGVLPWSLRQGGPVV